MPTFGDRVDAVLPAGNAALPEEPAPVQPDVLDEPVRPTTELLGEEVQVLLLDRVALPGW